MKAFNTLILAGLIAMGVTFSARGAAQEVPLFSQAELDQMLAPIALYPDTVLTHVLIAATYPLEVVQAARWSRDNPGLSGEEAVAWVEDTDWDPSVKALVAFPELLARMDQDIEWTQRLGDAFLMQEAQVADTIQYLRDQAYAQGHLQSNEHVHVVRETEYIYIEPARPEIIYVPYYDPFVVYGPWRWSAYPPVYWHHPPGFSFSLNFFWGTGYHVAPNFYFSSFHWPRRHVVVVDHHYYRHDRYDDRRRSHPRFRSGRDVAHYDGARRWQHNPQHRRGVRYQRAVDRSRFVQTQGTEIRRAAPHRTPNLRGGDRDWAAARRATRVPNDNAVPPRGDRRSRSGPAGQGDRDRAVGSGRSVASAPGPRLSERARSERPGSRALSRNRAAETNRPGAPTRQGDEMTSERLAEARSAPAPSRDSRQSRARQPERANRSAPTRRPELNRRAPEQRSIASATERRQRTRSVPERPAAAAVAARRPQSSAPAREARPRIAASQRTESAPPRRAEPAQRPAPPRRAEPTRRAEPNRYAESARRAEPAQRPAPPRHAEPSRRAEPNRYADSARRAEPARRVEPTRRAASRERPARSAGARSRDKDRRRD